MTKSLRVSMLQVLRALGGFRIVGNSRWRRERLMILCYHGVAQEDEHRWRPALYMDPRQLERRLRILKDGGFNVIELGEGLKGLRAGTLPPRSVAITFDDGTYDFYAQAYPLLKKFGFPVTVYQTTYYMDHEVPVFNVICSYMLWKRQGVVLERGEELGIAREMDLRSAASRQAVVRQLVDLTDQQDLSCDQKNAHAAKLANVLGIDYGELSRKRILQLMNAREVRQLAGEGVDFQLHTHRHRTPMNEALFRRELQDNAARLQEVVGNAPEHFCYPSGVYDTQFLPWLKKENVASATTCDTGLASVASDPLLLPRFVDTTGQSDVEFEGWVSGISQFLARSPASERD